MWGEVLENVSLQPGKPLEWQPKAGGGRLDGSCLGPASTRWKNVHYEEHRYSAVCLVAYLPMRLWFLKSTIVYDLERTI